MNENITKTKNALFLKKSDLKKIRNINNISDSMAIKSDWYKVGLDLSKYIQ